MPRRKERVQTFNDLPSRVVESDLNQANIHEILKRYKDVGIVDHLAQVDAAFYDVSEFTDYADLRMQTAEAERQFMQLPSKLREVFGHDVYNWLDAAHDREKLMALAPKLAALGLEVPGYEVASESDLAAPAAPAAPADQGASE